MKKIYNTTASHRYNALPCLRACPISSRSAANAWKRSEFLEFYILQPDQPIENSILLEPLPLDPIFFGEPLSGMAFWLMRTNYEILNHWFLNGFIWSLEFNCGLIVAVFNGQPSPTINHLWWQQPRIQEQNAALWYQISTSLRPWWWFGQWDDAPSFGHVTS